MYRVNSLKARYILNMYILNVFIYRDQYLQTVIYMLRNIKEKNARIDTDAPISVKQFRSIKIAVELIVAIGIIPSLLSGVGVGMAKLCPKALTIFQKEEELGCLEVRLFHQFL